MIIKIKDVLNSKDALLHSEGLTIFELINKAISEKKQVTLSFTGLDNCSAAFLMACIGKLYVDYPPGRIEPYLKYEGNNNKCMLPELIDVVIENAKDYEFHNNLMDDLLNEN